MYVVSGFVLALALYIPPGSRSSQTAIRTGYIARLLADAAAIDEPYPIYKPACEVRRTSLPRTRVNKGKRRAGALSSPGHRSCQAALRDANCLQGYDYC